MAYKRRNEKQIRYLMIKDGSVSICYTGDFKKVMDDEYRYRFDTTDNLFFEYPDIRVFVRDESIYDEDPNIYYYFDDELKMTFHGTVYFAKLGMYDFRSLSKKEVSFLLNRLIRIDEKTFCIRNDPKFFRSL